MVIKTIVHDRPEVFDAQVNTLLSQNWCLVKRGVIQDRSACMLYAELAQYDPSSPVDAPKQENNKSENNKQEIVIPSEDEEGTMQNYGELYNAMLQIHRFCARQDYCPACPLYRICGSELPDRWEC